MAEVQTNTNAFEIKCDGCARPIAVGERYLGEIESCCGGGCCRSLCAGCVIKAAALLVRS